MPKPNFLIVGAPKSGTTAMWRYLSAHPDIWMSPTKDLHYFGSDLGFAKRERYTENEYLAFFEQAKGTAIGEASVWYLYSKKAAEEIAHFNPEMRIIIMLRDPVQTMYALFTQMRLNGLGDEDQRDFHVALSLEEARKNGQHLPPGTPLPEALYYRDVVRFSEQTQRYLNVFPRENILILCQDDLRTDTAQVLRKAYAFLGVDPKLPVDTKPVNQHKTVRFESIRTLITMTPQWAKVLLSQTQRKKWGRTLRALNTKQEKRPPLDPNLQKQLQQELAPEVKRLSKVIQRDLSMWLPGPRLDDA